MLNTNTRFFLLISVLFSFSSIASTPVKKVIPVVNVFSPRGYDTLDSSEIVIKGLLPNSCHKTPLVSHTIKGKNIFIEVTSLYYQQPNPFCEEMVYPFVKTIELGNLEKGQFNVFINKGTELEKKTIFKVKDPILGEDKNQVYANVEYIERHLDENRVVLYGHNPSSCLALDKVRVIDNGRESISILPRMKKVSNFCPMKMVPFKINVNLDIEDDRKKTLIHVRSMYGNSVNTIY